MIRGLYILKLVVTVITLLFISLSIFRLSCLFIGVNMDITLVYVTIGFYTIVFLYLFLKRKLSFLSSYNESYLLLDTFLGLNKNNPFYSILYKKIKSFYRLFVREILYESVKLFIFASIFFASDNIFKKNNFTLISKVKPKIFSQFSETSASHSNNVYLLKSEIKKLEKIKNILRKKRYKIDEIINEAVKLKIINTEEKAKLIEKIISKDTKDVIKDLLIHTKNIKQQLYEKKYATALTGTLEEELLGLYKETKNKKNKKYKISVEHLNKWFGYEEVLKEYFK